MQFAVASQAEQRVALVQDGALRQKFLVVVGASPVPGTSTQLYRCGTLPQRTNSGSLKGFRSKALGIEETP